MANFLKLAATQAASTPLVPLLLLAVMISSFTSPSQADAISAPSDGLAAPIVASSTPSVAVNPIPAVTTSTGTYAVYGSRSGTGTSTYWSNNLVRVPPSLSLVWTLVKVFGPRVIKFFGNAFTLLDAIRNPHTEPLSKLAREASVSLLNSYTSPNFPLSPDQVLSIFNDALAPSNDLSTIVQEVALKFQLYNEAV